MSQIDEEVKVLPGAEEQEESANVRYVPVAESIRYRKRAQAAETKVGELADELESERSKVSEISRELEGLRLERSLSDRLLSAGVKDVEAAVLLAKKRLAGSGEDGVEGCVEELAKEKPYLFAGSKEVSVADKTAGVRDKRSGAYSAVNGAAKRAAASGSRSDVLEYLKLRRGIV